MKTKDAPIASRTAMRLTLLGKVQGLGVRPAIARLAQRSSLNGYVTNTEAGVEIHVEGLFGDLDMFQQELIANLPAAAVVFEMQAARVEPIETHTFEIRPLQRPGRVIAAETPGDIVVCESCLKDIKDDTNRRHDYGFTSCADCGPRYSIIRRMPFERIQTGMAGFDLCDDCVREYGSPIDRRFHAQTIACPSCGPQVHLRDRDGQVVCGATGAIDGASLAIGEGLIVALRGLGGYQLLVDATSQRAVQRLRQRKRRHGKPLAVMVASLADAEAIARLNKSEEEQLQGRAGPIVIAQRRDASTLAESVTRGFDTVGVMLPTTPLHWLLLNAAQCPLVCTSGNPEGDPLLFDWQEAFKQLQSIADVWLDHDRPILRPVDDSVIRVMTDRAVTIRAARGLSPMKLELQTDDCLIALGGQQKSAIAFSNGRQSVLCSHLGDLETIATRERFIQQMTELRELYGIARCRWVGDLHPDYFTTQWAESQPEDFIQVQHHHAHIVAGMLEHRWLDQTVLGVAFDGTGYGTDATIWGGEFLIASATTFTRVGHLRQFALLGGQRAVKEPWRIATALVADALGSEQTSRLKFCSADVTTLLPLLSKPRLSHITSSAGRLFDGIASLALGIERSEFEGQPAMLLEAACDWADVERYEFAITHANGKQLDWRPVIRQILRDQDKHTAKGAIAMRFHRGLAKAIVDVCSEYSSLPIVFGGGVFQNSALTLLLHEELSKTSQRYGFPGLIPPGDGGLAAGQLAVAASLSRQRSRSECV